MAVGLDDLQTIVAQDVAVAHAFVTYNGLSADGRELRAMHNRLTWALKQENGEAPLLGTRPAQHADPVVPGK